MKIFILDIYNILYKCKEFRKLINKSFENTVFSLLQAIQSYSSIHSRFKFYFVIDGFINGLESNYNNIIIKQSHKNNSADNLIRKIITGLDTYAETYIVTNDIEIINFAKLYTIKNITPQEFCKMIASNNKNKDINIQNKPEIDKPQHINSREVEFYKNLFDNPLDNDELIK